MATIQKRNDTYRITVSCGYDVNGKQIRKSTTYVPDQGMTEKQIKKELKRQAILFEEKCKTGRYIASSIKFATFAEKWFADYAEKQLKAKTIEGYKGLMGRINAAIGHLPLDKIQPIHLIEFYRNLSETGIKQDIKYIAAAEFPDVVKAHGLTAAKLAQLSGVSVETIKSCKTGKKILPKSAERICNALNMDITELFTQCGGDSKLTSNTILHYHRLIASILSTAVHWQVLADNPCSRVKPPKIEKKEAHYLDEAQAFKLLQCLEGEDIKYKVIVNLLLYLGLRRGELCGLKWDDIDFKNNLIHIQRANLYTKEKGVYEDTTKNNSSERVVKTDNEIIKLLIEYKMKYNANKVKAGDRWTDTGYIFTQWNGAPIHPGSITSWFSKFVKKHHLPPMSVHTLRHTNATLLIANGTDLRTVSKRLGHSNMSTTGNIYAHAIKSADERAADTLHDILKPISRNEQAQ